MFRNNILSVQKRLLMLCVTCFVFPGIKTNGIGNITEAIKSCEGRGGLAKSDFFRRVAGTWTMPSLYNRDFMTYDRLRGVIFPVEESAWVAGYAQFGEKFYTLEGCQDANNELNKYRETTVTHENNVFECGKFCEDNTSAEHFGLYQNKCVCLRKVMHNNVVDCKTPNDNMLFRFKLVKVHGLHMRNFQCGIIKQNGADWTQSSAKCLDSLSVMCTERESGRTYTWSDAAEFCGNEFDKMHSYLTEAMKAKANRSNTYWLSAFRSFRVHDQNSLNTDPCLSVTRTGNSLTLQPDDCGIRQKYICANDIEGGNNNRTDGDNGKNGDNNNAFQGITTRPSTEKDGHPEEESKSPDNYSNPKNTTGIVIGIIASVVVVVSLLIGGIICLRRRKATKKAHRSLMSESSIDTHVIKDTFTIGNTTKHCVNSGNEHMEEHEYACPEDMTNTVSSTNPNNLKIRPDKPARNTLRRNQKLNETYENFKLVSTENRKVDENEDEGHGEFVTKTDKDEYDLLCHNMAAPSTKQERADIHVYDHTPFKNNDNEDYDSTLPGRGNKHTPAGNVDDYDTVNLSNNEKNAKKKILF